LHLGAIDPQPHTIGRGVGEHIRQRPQPQPALTGHGEPACRQQRPDLPGSAGDGGPVDSVEHRQRSVRQLEPQHDKGGDHPVSERQFPAWSRSLRAQPVPPAPRPQPRLLLRQPRRRELLNQLAERAIADPGADTMRQGRAGPSRRHILIVPRGRSHFRDRHAKIIRYVPDVLSCTNSLEDWLDIGLRAAFLA
jgi:hypothetical protein